MESPPHGMYQHAHAIIGAIHGLAGFHPGFRAMHPLGRIYRGTFTASGAGAALTRAVHFQPGAIVPATARFSYGGADPKAPVNGSAGMAIKFYLDDGTVTDLVMLNRAIFPAALPEDYLSIAAAAADPATLQAWLAERPKAAAAFKANAESPAAKSLAETRFHGMHVFWFENAAGQRRAIRYEFEPVAGVSGQSAAEFAAMPEEYLFTELEERLAHGPVAFDLVVRLGEPGDNIVDPTTDWPEPRERVTLGRLALQRRTSTAELGDPIMLHDPTRTTDGIDVSDDPILNVRRGTYEVSAVNRGDSWKVRTAQAATPE
jgi:catalase